MYGDSKSQAQGIVGRRESGSNILPALPSAQIAADNYLHASPAPAVGCKARVCHHALSGEAHALLSVQQRIDRDLCLLHTIIRDLEFRQEGYSLRDVVDRFRNSRRSTVLAYVETQAARFEANGKLGTAAQLPADTRSFSDFLGGRDIPFSLVDERLVGQYDDWLRAGALSAIPSRFICGYCARSIIKP